MAAAVAATVLAAGVGVTVIVFAAAGVRAELHPVASRPKEATPTMATLTAVSRRRNARIAIIPFASITYDHALGSPVAGKSYCRRLGGLSHRRAGGRRQRAALAGRAMGAPVVRGAASASTRALTGPAPPALPPAHGRLPWRSARPGQSLSSCPGNPRTGITFIKRTSGRDAGVLVVPGG